MASAKRITAGAVSLVGLLLAANSPAQAAAPTVEQALMLAPVQRDVSYEKPQAAEIARCTIQSEKVGEGTGWVVRDAAGRTLRQFVDTNGDNVVDIWSYYENGVEVYRDIDSGKKGGKADQYRWLYTGGTRWGLDPNRDGVIDAWKQISAEEASAEAVRALAGRDPARFERLLLTADELRSLGLGADQAKQLAAKIASAPAEFRELLSSQRAITANTRWVHFGGAQPGVVPAGAEGSSADVIAYENVVAMVETDGQDGQLLIGTLVSVGDAWRLIGAPRVLTAEGANELAATGFFFQAPITAPSEGGGGHGGTDVATQKLFSDLERIDQAVAAAGSPAEMEKLNADRADLLERLADAVNTPGDRAQWIRQMADTISASVQSGAYAGGVDRLKELQEKLSQNSSDEDLKAYVEFRYLMADYGQSLQSPNADFAKIQTEWLDKLKGFVTANPTSPDAAEAMLQLGIAQEYAGQDEEAKQWYQQIVDKFPQSPAAQKGAGAVVRLDSVGKVIRLQGQSTTGSPVDLARYRGKVVLVHYWATWCEPCKADMAVIKELLAKYAKSGFTVIGISLDSRPEELADYLKQNRTPWVQIFEQGGLDSRLANELGVLTLPTMLLIDQQGKVVNRSVHVTELDKELSTRLR